MEFHLSYRQERVWQLLVLAGAVIPKTSFVSASKCKIHFVIALQNLMLLFYGRQVNNS